MVEALDRFNISSFSFLIVARMPGIYKIALVYHEKRQQDAGLGSMVQANRVVSIEREFTMIGTSKVCNIPISRK
jgi:hypothetical protein